MTKLTKWRILGMICLLLPGLSFAQKTKASIYDYGKMWTFDHAPIEYFNKTYNIKVDQEWFDDVRQSALKFATWCSASFVSPNGLIMTNHHCSEGEVAHVIKEGEHILEEGFYAKKLEDERRSPDLFVDQLTHIADITKTVKEAEAKGKTDQEKLEKRAAAIESIKERYSKMKGWENLRLEVVNFYSGGQFSIYGYKRYDDIRLVFIPEVDLGFFGGDPDNFTYPRYNLDCTFWRAYENGKPANTSSHYFEFNPEGATEGEPVFVIGNPASTERYRTVAQLEFDRDARYNILLESLRNRYNDLSKEYETNPSLELRSQIFGLSNSIKAISGIESGLRDKNLMQRKIDMENMTKSKFKGTDYWSELASIYKKLKPYGPEINLLSPSPLNGAVIALLHQLYGYKNMVASGNASDADIETQKKQLLEMISAANTKAEQNKFVDLLNRLQIHDRGDKYLQKVFNGKSSKEIVAKMFKKSKLMNSKKVAKKLKPKKFKKLKDPFLDMAEILVPRFGEAANLFRSSSAKRKVLEGKISNAMFQVHGTNLPPDATFTLRISDGIVKGYNYNGTKAPWKTTFFGLYDRYYSNDKKYPWALPKKWLNPPMEMLSQPLNFVSTNDIIGGNSGSAIINSKGQAIGLIFDGNIESLPGNFIFDQEYNRTVSVHAGGIFNALKHIYKAERLYKELTGK